MSSEQRSAPVAAAYAFEQLEATAIGPGGTTDLLSVAIAQAERIREQARLKGEADGRAAGIAAGRSEVDAALAALSCALDGVGDLQRTLVAALEQDAAALAFQLSEHILASVLDVEPERVVDVARNALRRVVDRRRVTLTVHPDDLEILSDSIQRLQAELGGIEHCEVQADRRIGRGGALLRTEAGEIDVTVDTQLERAREIVAAALRGEHDGS
jgi:flagellar assembly protein FliH